MRPSYIAAVTILLALAMAGCKKGSSSGQEQNPFLIEPGTRPLVIAHRGGKGLMPEATMLAFDNAVNLGADVLEMDIVLTKDSIPVIIHDLTIDRTSDTTGLVHDYTLAELKQFNFGYNFQDSTGAYPYRNNPVRIPTLTEVLTAYPNMLMNIEIKDTSALGYVAADILVADLNKYHDPKKVIGFAFLDEIMLYLRSINTDGMYTGASLSEGLAFYNAVIANNEDNVTVDADVFSIPSTFGPFTFTADSLVEAVHAKGVAVHYWTINDTSEMRQLVNLGADAIITDYPDRLLQVLDEMGF